MKFPWYYRDVLWTKAGCSFRISGLYWAWAEVNIILESLLKGDMETVRMFALGHFNNLKKRIA